MSKRNRVWVIEEFIRNAWRPSGAINSSKLYAVTMLRNWIQDFPDNKIRLTKYVAEGKKT
jgi:hypothetical protein